MKQWKGDQNILRTAEKLLERKQSGMFYGGLYKRHTV